MLRDVLTSFAGVETWPCDEIPFVWRYGNSQFEHDEFTPDMARPATKRYIRGAFKSMAKSKSARFLIEKTCANSLRVGFVNAVVPDAKYIYLVRDGRDVVLSAMKRWVAPLDVQYMLKKARFVPPTDLPYYGSRFLWNRIQQYRSSDRRLSTWGPRIPELTELARRSTLAEVCAHQWHRSVERAETELDQLDDDRVTRVRYEDFVSEPVDALGEIVGWLGIDASDTLLRRATSKVSTKSVGNGLKGLSEEDIERVDAIGRPALENHGYLNVSASK